MRPKNIKHQVTPVEELTDTDKRQMHQLMERHFENMERDVFLLDLAEKNWVIRLFDEKTGELSGFSTQMLFPIEAGDKEVLAVFSGDTIVDRESWGTMALGLAAVRLAFSLIGQHPDRELYWFLISKGYRTYRFLPVYFHEFFPRHDRETPAWASEVIDACGRRKFSDRYDSTLGLVRADQNGCRLREGVGTVTEERLNDPHVRFFLERNPGHTAGDELCCIAALKPENFVAKARKWVAGEETLEGKHLMGLANFLNTVWMRQCKTEALRYERAAESVAEAQWQVLRDILRRNSDGEYGQKYRFSKIRSVQEYQDRVPVCTHESLRESIQRIAAGQSRVLTVEPVLMFEPTSGTSGGEKWIPYTQSLKREFQRALSAWVWDTLSKRPDLRRGRSFWSLSPASASRRVTEGGIPVGFEDDTQYLSLSQRFASSYTLAVSPLLARMTHLENFRYAALLQLLRTPELTMVSVWSPSFLIALLDALDDCWPSICRDLCRGAVDLPVMCAADSALVRRTMGRPDPARAKRLEAIFAASSMASETYSAVWPRLGMISCWTDASAAQFIPKLREKFPDVEIQPKGLLATEGVVSIPRVSCDGTALALRSHFLEFAEVRDDSEAQDSASHASCENIRPAHELERGRLYQVILTTGGGLYRYRLGDLIRVVGWFKQCPLIEFLGRASASSDLVGEKLHERHVREVVERAFADEGLAPEFFLLAPVTEPKPHYCLFFQGSGVSPTPSWAESLADRVQRGLETNPYYQHATGMGQLDEVKVVILDSSGEPARMVYERVCVERGQKAGDIKPVALNPKTSWLAAFAHLTDASTHEASVVTRETGHADDDAESDLSHNDHSTRGPR